MWLVQLEEEDNDDLKALINLNINKTIIVPSDQLSQTFCFQTALNEDFLEIQEFLV